MEDAGFLGFDRRADDRFWFAYGQLYGYHGILSAMDSDFREVFPTTQFEFALVANRLATGRCAQNPSASGGQWKRLPAS